MSTAILDAFVTLLRENPEIIPDRDDLKLKLDQPYEDVYELAEMVEQYCEAHPELKTAIRNLEKPKLKPDLDLVTERLPGNGHTRPVLQVADYKYTILNTMHRVMATPAPIKKPSL
jgi:hypothetical protein